MFCKRKIGAILHIFEGGTNYIYMEVKSLVFTISY